MTREIINAVCAAVIATLIAGGLWLMLAHECVVQWPTWPVSGGNVGSPTLIEEANDK